jgi:F-box/leucine-rich repeat protein 2/20
LVLLLSQFVAQRRLDAINPSFATTVAAFFSQQISSASMKLAAAIAKQQSAEEVTSNTTPNFIMQKIQSFLHNDAAMDLMHGRTFSMAIDQVEEFVVEDIMENIDAFGSFQLLHKLQLNQCAGITDSGLMDILRHTVGLRTLEIASCEHVTNSSAVLIGKYFPHLEELDISGCFMITDSGFLHIIDNCFALKRLNVTGCSRITDGQLAGLRDRCTGLTSLSAGGQLLLGPEGILGMISLPCLQFLSMPGTSFAEVRVSQNIGAASSLVDLNFSEISNVRDWDVCAFLKCCISLQSLDLSMCQFISGVAWNTVASNCCRLTVMDVSGSESFNDEHLLSFLSNCRMLQELRASFCKKITDESVPVIIYQGQALTRLELMGCSISAECGEEMRGAMLDTHIII